jgi:hypothetical protein
MDRRKEARFQVYAPAKVALLDDPETEWNGQVIDISGLGLRLVADVEFHQDQIITVETDQHLILADVRNCEPRGSRFAVGAERVHSSAKVSLSTSASKAERNHELVEEYHRRLLEELPGAPDQAAPRSSAALRRFEESHSAPAPVASAVPQPDAPIEEPQPIVAVATPETIATTESEPQSVPIPMEPPAAGVFSPRITPVKPAEIKIDSHEHLPFTVAPKKVSSNVVPIKTVVDPLPASPENTEPEAKATEEVPTVEDVPAVAEVPEVLSVPPSTDAADAIRQAFLQSEVQEPTPPKARSRSVLAILIAAAFTLVALAVIWLGPFAKHAPLQTFAAAQSTVAPPTAPAPTDSKPAPAPETTPAPAPAPTPAPIQTPAHNAPALNAPSQEAPVPAGQSRAVIEASDKSWVTACSDGKVAFTKLFMSGTKENLVFSSTAVVRVGNAGSLEISLNGKSVGPLGRPGQLRVVELTPSSTRFIPLHDPDGCTQ